MRSLCWKCNFRANFGVLPLGFDVKALIPQGFTGSPNYFGFLNNLMTLIICESLREIGEVACVTSAWSSRGQTLKLKKLLNLEYEAAQSKWQTSISSFIVYAVESRFLEPPGEIQNWFEKSGVREIDDDIKLRLYSLIMSECSDFNKSTSLHRDLYSQTKRP